ncbi:MAG: hypothetical protein LIP01_10065 [Tannerellaceae bacterium]|nr:hypothetical protein [Tannerellaceae bacterium]
MVKKGESQCEWHIEDVNENLYIRTNEKQLVTIFISFFDRIMPLKRDFPVYKERALNLIGYSTTVGNEEAQTAKDSGIIKKV